MRVYVLNFIHSKNFGILTCFNRWYNEDVLCILDGQPDPKKMAAINDPIGAQLKAIADQQRAQQTQQAVQAAASAAAQINAKLGIQSQGGQPVSFGLDRQPCMWTGNR